MTFSETLTFLYEQLPMFQRQGPMAMKKDLTNILALCEALGNPHKGLKMIHLAGTNGKGSTSHIISSLLQQHGLKVGLYTSPHYKDFRERIKINAELIPKRWVSSFVAKHRDLFKNIQPSFFEITVAMAFLYFKEAEVDVAIIETGLGGRLDSTNIIDPIFSIITNIGFDHQNFLGDTLPEIAGEKAGIIKTKRPVILGRYQRSIIKVFREKAKAEKARLILAKDEIEVKSSVGKNGYLKMDVEVDGKNYNLQTDLAGQYQSENIRTALVAYFQWLHSVDLPLQISKIKKALATVQCSTYFIGRWQILQSKPRIILDSCHNIDGVQMALQQLEQLQYSTLHIVWGTVKDKDPSPILKLLPKRAKYYFAKAAIPRGMTATELEQIANEIGLKGKSYNSVRLALKAAKKNAVAQDIIFVAGSIFVVAEVL